MEARKIEFMSDAIAVYFVYLRKIWDVLEIVKKKMIKTKTDFDFLEENGDLSEMTLKEVGRGMAIQEDEEKKRAYSNITSRQDEFTENLVEALLEGSERHTLTREPILRKEILPYIVEAIKAGIGAGLTPHIWALAVDYGLDEDKFGSDKKWAYEPSDNLSEEDKEALWKTAEEIYEAAVYFLMERNISKIVNFINCEEIAFTPYPFGGMNLEEVEKIVGEEEASEICGAEDGDLLFFLPFVVSRIDEAIYTSLYYSGDEYLQYISALNLEEDWDKVNGVKYGSYKTITERS